MANLAECSFCSKTQKAVEKLIAGPEGVYICNECIDICNLTINTHRNKKINRDPKMDVLEETMYCAMLQNYDDDIIDDMVRWLNDNIKNSWVKPYEEAVFGTAAYKIIFENESDLVAFKLRWT